MSLPLLREAVSDLAAFLRFQRLLGRESLALGPEALSALDRLARPPSPPKTQAQPKSQPPRTKAAPRPQPALPPEDLSGLTLDELKERAAACRRCHLGQSRTQVVFGEGPAPAEIMFVGEGPGAEEDLSGRPFVGPAGQKLTEIVRAMGLERSEVYIANVVKCRPPGNRPPLPEEAQACRMWLEAQMDLVKPRVLVALGRISAWNLLDTREAITRLRGRWGDLGGVPVMPTFHPSYLIRGGPEDTKSQRRAVWEDMKQVLTLVGRKPPEKK